jgi:leucyl aminopeptidase
MKIELTHLTLAESKANKAKNPSVVVFATSTKKDKKSVVKITHEGLHHRLNESIEDKTIKGSENETILYRDLYFEGARHVIVAGLGDESKMTHETLRQSAAAIYDRVKASNMGHIFVDFDGVPHTAENAASFIQAFTEGLLLASYSFNELKSSASIKNHVLSSLEYKGAAASKKPVAFVGKGLTFDCGGISIKPSAGMEEMKYDMCGGAAVIGTMLAISQLKLKVNVVAYVPATENMPGSRATKPGDIHTARNGKTFEINNTDAEGRLILSDALCYASRITNHKPSLMQRL